MLSDRSADQNQIYQMLSCFSDTILFVYKYSSDVLILSSNGEMVTGLKEYCFPDFSCDPDNGFIKCLQEDGGLHLKDAVACPPEAGKYKTFELQFMGMNSKVHWCVCKVTALYEGDETTPVQLIGKIDDVSLQKEKETRLFIQSTRDGLTGLLNKTAFEYMVNEALKDGVSGSLCMIDIDNFKDVNDRFGHQAGDGILVYVGKLLTHIFGENTLIGRVGGDEFMVYVEEKQFDRDTLKACAGKLLRDVADSGGIADYHASVSIGISRSEDGTRGTYQRLFAHADNAMYQAKQNGKNRAAEYGETDDTALQRQVSE